MGLSRIPIQILKEAKRMRSCYRIVIRMELARMGRGARVSQGTVGGAAVSG